MTPHHIVLGSRESRYKTKVAITDHNVSGNVEAAIRAAASTDVTVLPGMEIETAEEAHLVVLFDTLDAMHAWQAIVDQALPPRQNDAQRFGAQYQGR